MTASLVEVAVPVPQLPALTYTVPATLTVPAVGARVRVPLGSRVVTGCVLSVGQAPDGDAGAPSETLKAVAEVIDPEPFLPAAVLRLAVWVAEYYACGVGDAVAAAMPPFAWVRQGRRDARVDAFRTVRWARLTADGRAREPEGLRGTGQRRVVELLRGAADGVPLRELVAQGVGRATVTRLAELGWLVQEERRDERDPFPPSVAEPVPSRETLTPTPEQRQALDTLTRRLDDARFHVALLHGVTGSGKTEVYVRLAEAAHARGRRVLVLVPEIALAPAVARAFRGVFGTRVAIQHSGLSAGERHDQWHRIRRGEIDVVVGTRSAVFAPLEDLGLLIVDEEHDPAYKQDEAPRYHGRDAAVVRARQDGALVVLGSATPSMESYENSRRGRYSRVELTERVEARPLPTVRIVDMRGELASEGPDVIVSQPLQTAIETRLGAGEQALVLLNRRGFAPTVLCRQCGETLECPNCSVTLTLHRAANRVRCHYCDYALPRPRVCPNCAGPYLERVGVGTERIELELRRLYPAARVARLDRDTARKRGAVTRVLSSVARREVDLLVGTQMIAKGHDFPAVTLVGVISADIGLGVADFRAAERTFQLLTQVAGRAGRGDRPGEAVIQTFHPEHYSIGFATEQAYGPFFDAERGFRESMRYPPVVSMVNAVVRGRTLAEAMRDAGDLATASRGRPGVAVLGPAPAPVARLRGEYRAQIFLKGTHRPALREAIQAALAETPALARRVVVDVDPLSLL